MYLGLSSADTDSSSESEEDQEDQGSQEVARTSVEVPQNPKVQEDHENQEMLVNDKIMFNPKLENICPPHMLEETAKTNVKLKTRSKDGMRKENSEEQGIENSKEDAADQESIEGITEQEDAGHLEKIELKQNKKNDRCNENLMDIFQLSSDEVDDEDEMERDELADIF